MRTELAKCSKCGEYDFTDRHRCLPGFLVWHKEEGEEEFARKVHALDMCDAAEQWAERDDSESADYLIVSGQDARVAVKDMETGAVGIFIVSGESVPSYSANEVIGLEEGK